MDKGNNAVVMAAVGFPTIAFNFTSCLTKGTHHMYGYLTVYNASNVTPCIKYSLKETSTFLKLLRNSKFCERKVCLKSLHNRLRTINKCTCSLYHYTKSVFYNKNDYPKHCINMCRLHFYVGPYGLFPPTEMDSDLDSVPDGYIVLCRTFSTGLDSDSDPCMESFPNGYYTHFDRSPSLFHTFESRDQSLNLNQWKNLHSTRICVGI